MPHAHESQLSNVLLTSWVFVFLKYRKLNGHLDVTDCAFPILEFYMKLEWRKDKKIECIVIHYSITMRAKHACPPRSFFKKAKETRVIFNTERSLFSPMRLLSTTDTRITHGDLPRNTASNWRKAVEFQSNEIAIQKKNKDGSSVCVCVCMPRMPYERWAPSGKATVDGGTPVISVCAAVAEITRLHWLTRAAT